jgi:hypothetical protein
MKLLDVDAVYQQLKEIADAPDVRGDNSRSVTVKELQQLSADWNSLGLWYHQMAARLPDYVRNERERVHDLGQVETNENGGSQNVDRALDRNEILERYIFSRVVRTGTRFGWRCKNASNRVGPKGSFSSVDDACTELLREAARLNVPWRQYAHQKVCINFSQHP